MRRRLGHGKVSAEQDSARLVSSDAGFGLVEIVVAMALFAVIVVVAGAGLLASLQSATGARDRSVATSLLSSADASLQATPYATLATGAPAPTSTTIGGVTYTTTTTETKVTSGPESGLLDLGIVVGWPTPGGHGTSTVTGQLQIGPS